MHASRGAGVRHLGAVIATAIAACSNLPAVEPDTCGNGVIDPGEDCDGSGGASAGTCAPPGSVAACHFICVAGNAGSACPSGYACGVDGECRQPSGLFAAVGEPELFGADDLGAGDVDGDGITDLIGTSQDTLTVGFGSPTGVLDAVDSQTIIAPDGATQFGDINGDGLVDVVYPSQAGLFTFLADARTFSPFAYSSITPPNQIVPPVTDTVRLVAVTDGSATPTGLDTPLVAITDGVLAVVAPLEGRGTCFDGSDAGSIISLRSLTCSTPTSGRALVGHHIARAVTGVQIAFGSDTNDSIAIGSAGGTAVRLFTPITDPAGDLIMKLYQTVDLAGLGSDYALTSGAGEILFGHFDRDPCIDLVIPVTHHGVPELAIAFGTGNAGGCQGMFGSAMHLCPLGSATDPDCGAGVAVGSGSGSAAFFEPVALAAADLDGDGLTDLVLSNGVLLGSSSGSGNWSLAQDVVAAFPRAWDDVVVADVNHDGALDLVGVVHGQDDVDVLLDTGVGPFNPVALPTPLPVRHVDTADFDGDGTGDIAVAIGLTDSSNEQDHVAVSYGTGFGEPVPFVDMGTFAETISMIPASLVFGPLDFNTISDLVVIDVETGSATSHVAVLKGSTSRRMLAPLIAEETVGSGAMSMGAVGCGGQQTLPVSPIAAALGNFTQTTPDYEDVAMLSDVQVSCAGVTQTLFFGVSATGIGGGDLSLSLGSASELPDVAAARFAFFDAVYATAHVGTDILLGVDVTDDPRHGGSDLGLTPAVVTLAAMNGSALGPVGAGSGSPFTTLPTMLEQMRTHSLRVADIHGTGRSDTALLELRGSGGATATAVLTPSAAGTTFTSMLAVAPGCRNAVPLRVTATGALELAMICPDGTGQQLVFVDAATGAAQSQPSFAIPPTDELVVGDFDGDGLDDLALVLTTSRAVQIVRQCAVEEPCGKQ